MVAVIYAGRPVKYAFNLIFYTTVIESDTHAHTCENSGLRLKRLGLFFNFKYEEHCTTTVEWCVTIWIRRVKLRRVDFLITTHRRIARSRKLQRSLDKRAQALKQRLRTLTLKNLGL